MRPASRRNAPRRWSWGESAEIPRRVLAAGGLLAIPTESSYGLAADPQNPEAVEAVYRLKRREAGKALPVLVAAVEDLPGLGVVMPAQAEAPLRRLWPAALTAVLPLRAGHSLPAAAGRGRLGLRVPAHGDLRRLLARVGPVTATSANLSGEPPALAPDDAAALLAEAAAFGVETLLVDGGRLPGGPASTLVAWGGGGWELLRPGPVPFEALEPKLQMRREMHEES